MDTIPDIMDSTTLLLDMYKLLLDKEPLIAGVVLTTVIIAVCSLGIAVIVWKIFGKVKHHTDNSDDIKTAVISLDKKFSEFERIQSQTLERVTQNTEDIQSVNSDLQRVKERVVVVENSVAQLKVRSIN